MMPSKSRIGIRQCPEHRAKQRVFFALSLGAKLSGLYSVLVANRHRVGRKTHRAANAQILPRKKFPEQTQLGGHPPDLLARILTREINAAANKCADC